MFTQDTHKINSESILYDVQIIRLGNFFWQIIPCVNFTYKKEYFRLFKVADADLSLKQWLALKGRKSCANVKRGSGV